MKQKNTTSNYWFKRRRYGFGWTPVSWQGWFIVILFLLVALGGTYILKDTPRNTFSNEVVIYLVTVLVAVILLIIAGCLKGPKPKWRWGKKAEDDPKIDF